MSVTVRFADFRSRAPLAELKYTSNTTFADLKLSLLQHMAASEDPYPARVFSKFYLKGSADAGNTDLTNTANEETIKSLGIEDESTVLCEGPETLDLDGIGRALSILNANGQLASYLSSVVLAKVVDSLKQLKDENEALRKENRALTALVANLSSSVNGQMNNIHNECAALKHENMNLTAILDALSDDTRTLRGQNELLANKVTSLTSHINSHRYEINELSANVQSLQEDIQPGEEHEEEEEETGYEFENVHHEPRSIPWINGTCYKCGEYGHRRTDCPNRYN